MMKERIARRWQLSGRTSGGAGEEGGLPRSAVPVGREGRSGAGRWSRYWWLWCLVGVLVVCQLVYLTRFGSRHHAADSTGGVGAGKKPAGAIHRDDRTEGIEDVVGNDDGGEEERDSTTDANGVVTKVDGAWHRYEGHLNDGGAGRLREVDEGNDLYVTPYSATERLRPKRINECRKGDTMGLCARDKRIAYAVELIYPVWVIDMPKFARPEHRDRFLKVEQVVSYMKQHDGRDCQESKCKGVKFDVSEKLVFHDEQYTYGHLVVVEHGVYAGKPTTSFGGKYECEWPSSYTMLLESSLDVDEVDRAAIFVGPQGYSYQHFVDRLMPDIAQAWDLVSSDPSWLIIGQVESTDMRGQIWKHLFANHQRSTTRTLKAKEMLYPCRVPRFHPWIWQRMRNMLGVVDVPLHKRTKIVYLSRSKSRKVLNEIELIQAMQEFVARRNVPGEELVIFDHSKYPTLNATRDFFNHQVKAVIGPHGGAFYNINFSPRDTLVVEFFPISASNKGLRYPEGTWWQAACLQHNYYMIPATSARGDVTIDIDDVISIMEREL